MTSSSLFLLKTRPRTKKICSKTHRLLPWTSKPEVLVSIGISQNNAHNTKHFHTALQTTITLFSTKPEKPTARYAV